MNTYRNALKLLAIVLVAGLGALVAPRPASAANGPDAQQAWYAAQADGTTRLGGSVPVVYTSTGAYSTVLNLFYNGPATAAYVSISGSVMSFFAPFGVVDTSIGVGGSGTIDISESTSTLGPLCDTINTSALYNGLPRYHCTLTGGIRSDPTTYLPSVTETNGVNNLATSGGYTVPFGTSTIISLDLTPPSGKHIVLDYCTVNTTGTPALQVFGIKAKFGAGKGYFGDTVNDSSLVWQSPALVANSTTNEPLATPVALSWLEFAPATQSGFGAGPLNQYNAPTGNLASNGHVVVRVSNYGLGVAGNTSANFLSCVGQDK